MAKQPTATAFTRSQESWASHVADRVRADIIARESVLRDDGVPEDQWDADRILMDLYDDELFWDRYADEMVKQREYIREKYL